MVAKEAGTSLAAKNLIALMPGLTDVEWTGSLDKVQGSITTFTSEYGEKNHAIVTHAVLFLQSMHDTIFSKPRDSWPALLIKHKDEIIAGLNANHLRVWFGKKTDGQVVDLEDMTYLEVIACLVEIMYSKRLQHWLYNSYQQIVLDFINHTELRLSDFKSSTGSAISLALTQVDPENYVSQILDAYPNAAMQLIASEDIQYFIALCKCSGQKVVPFVPVLDMDLSMFVLKDMLWFSEHLYAAYDCDIEHAVIQQGVVSSHYLTKVNEPAKEILDGIYYGHIDALLQRMYGGDKSKVPVVECIASSVLTNVASLPNSVIVNAEQQDIATFTLPFSNNELPSNDQWIYALSGHTLSWLYFLMTLPSLVKGTSLEDNFMLQVMRA
ncbi:hypothetical protein FB639_003519 [Coemansia asiatica]|nr:hypothetical protein FB639_003519 [Coemansia asiatica]